MLVSSKKKQNCPAAGKKGRNFGSIDAMKHLATQKHSPSTNKRRTRTDPTDQKASTHKAPGRGKETETKTVNKPEKLNARNPRRDTRKKSTHQKIRQTKKSHRRIKKRLAEKKKRKTPKAGEDGKNETHHPKQASQANGAARHTRAGKQARATEQAPLRAMRKTTKLKAQEQKPSKIAPKV